ncbi:MAG: prepilin-type N-terminal cleavage/methylation domain-containing protein, partial [Patescibacteria group bacterium]
MNKHSKGFTLIEVLIVISIIGVLSSLTLLGLGTFRASGRDVRRVTDLRQITNALELYYAKNGSYPATAGWEIALAKPAATGVIDKVPKDPGSSSYGYGICTGGYVVKTTLEEANAKILAEGYLTVTGDGCETTCNNSATNKE